LDDLDAKGEKAVSRSAAGKRGKIAQKKKTSRQVTLEQGGLSQSKARSEKKKTRPP